MNGLLLADFPVAVIQHLKADQDVAALVGGRVAMSMPEGRRAWSIKTDNAIVVRPSGGPAPDMYTDAHFARCDLSFFGAGETPNVRRRMARLIWRTVQPVLCPPPNLGVPMGWVNTDLDVIVKWVRAEIDQPFSAPEPNTDWDRVIMPYLFCWSPLRTVRLSRSMRAVPSSLRVVA